MYTKLSNPPGNPSDVQTEILKYLDTQNSGKYVWDVKRAIGIASQSSITANLRSLKKKGLVYYSKSGSWSSTTKGKKQVTKTSRPILNLSATDMNAGSSGYYWDIRAISLHDINENIVNVDAEWEAFAATPVGLEHFIYFRKLIEG